MRYFLGRMQRRLRLLFRLPRCGFSLKRAESSFGCCTLPPTKRQGRQNNLHPNVSIEVDVIIIAAAAAAAAQQTLPKPRPFLEKRWVLPDTKRLFH